MTEGTVIDLRSVPEPVEAAAMVPERVLLTVGADSGPDDRLAAFLDAFVHSQGNRMPAREASRLAEECGVETARFFRGARPILKVDGSDRVLTMAGRKL